MSFGAPKIASVGEIHWLVDTPPSHMFDQWGASFKQWRPKCMCCYGIHRHWSGPCPVFGRQPNEMVTEGTLYEDVAKAAGCEVLITSDKMPGNFGRFVKPGDMDGIFLFKRPEASVVSDLRHRPISFEEAVSSWLKWNRELETWCQKYCNNFVVVSYERLAYSYREHVRAICRNLSLPEFEVPKDVAAAPAWHAIGGNPGAYHRGDVFVDTRWKTELTDERVEKIRANVEIQDLYASLLDMALPEES